MVAAYNAYKMLHTNSVLYIVISFYELYQAFSSVFSRNKIGSVARCHL